MPLPPQPPQLPAQAVIVERLPIFETNSVVNAESDELKVNTPNMRNTPLKNGISLQQVSVGKKSSGCGLTSVPYGSDFNPTSSKGHSDELLLSAADQSSKGGLTPRANKKLDSLSFAKKLNAALVNSSSDEESIKPDKLKSSKSKKRTTDPENYDYSEADRLHRQIMMIANYQVREGRWAIQDAEDFIKKSGHNPICNKQKVRRQIENLERKKREKRIEDVSVEIKDKMKVNKKKATKLVVALQKKLNRKRVFHPKQVSEVIEEVNEEAYVENL